MVKTCSQHERRLLAFAGESLAEKLCPAAHPAPLCCARDCEVWPHVAARTEAVVCDDLEYVRALWCGFDPEPVPEEAICA